MRGLEAFKTYFSEFDNYYVLIGGTACTIIFEEVGLDFRATKDIDMVLIVEMIDSAFGEVFWEFIKAGGYRNIYMSSENQNFYRFDKPKNIDFPQMVELFAREPNEFKLAEGYHLIPLHIADDIASLSAILLNSDYYIFLLQGKKKIEGLSVLDELRLIPFKAKAWCELTDRHNAGEEGLSKHIKKHRNDVAKLLTLISADVQIELHGMVEADMKRFVKAMSVDILDENVTGIKGMTTDLFCTRLHEIYRI
ncbi:hypothetical protein [Fusibacter ferrireducens]|uniref:Nucleotidyl transferase AbiEii toxin, Type IV TA system n=1 Tax=Fusibacter ferrireducens TaxID=2785058 RepID=A0ABR9ZWC8_9FIRM|nr:hypothetical protein [Fusibacter ferrireducens]MBF4694754.1 hypothetical protein [Fusibacter ferrireducens]